MRKGLIFLILVICLVLTSCNESASIGIIGGADGPTSIFVSGKDDNIRRSYDVDKYFENNYVDENKLPVLDIHIENPYVWDDRILILEDSIENNLELMVYEYYLNTMSGEYSKVKDAVAGKSLRIATENEEKQFNQGAYFNKIIIDDIDIVDKDELRGISEYNKQKIIEMLKDLQMTEFAIVEVEKEVKMNDKLLKSGPQIGDGELVRYYLLGKGANGYKIVEVYWQEFLN